MEDVAAEYRIGAGMPALEAAQGFSLRRQSLVGKKGGGSHRAQLHAQHGVTRLRQPDHVAALAAQGDQDPRCVRHLQPLPEPQQVGVELFVVPADGVVVPTLQPVLVGVMAVHAETAYAGQTAQSGLRRRAAAALGVRAAEINNCPKIAPDFGPDSRRGKGRILEYVTLAATQKLSQKTSKIGC